MCPATLSVTRKREGQMATQAQRLEPEEPEEPEDEQPPVVRPQPVLPDDDPNIPDHLDLPPKRVTRELPPFNAEILVAYA